MTGLEAAAAAAAKAVVQRAGHEWLAARAERDERGRNLAELIRVSFPDRFAQRKLERQLADIADSVERRLSALIAIEYRGLADNDRASVFAEVCAVMERADLSDAALMAADVDPVRLARQVRAGMSPLEAQLGEGCARLYDVALDECCDCLVRIIRQLPQFVPRAAVEMLSRLSGLGEQVAVVLERLPARTLDAPSGTQDDLEFERRYLEHLGATLNEIELFGVRVDNYQPRTELSVAYVSLQVTAEESALWPTAPLKFASMVRPQASEEGVANMRAETALGRFPRTLLRGQAGSGKSTLLRWIAVTAARGGFTGDLSGWNGRIPFLINLRSFAERALPEPQDFVQGPLAALMPPGWAHRRLAEGRALLLADGIDEMIPSKRPLVRQWMRDLLSAYPSTRAVVSSRPAAADSRWLSSEGFVPLALEPMGPGELRALIRHWHSAISHSPGLPCRPEDLPRYEGALLARLESGPHLRALAATPLLAAMMCALNLDRATHLPRDRMGLYAAALEMLLERRDTERAIPANQDVALEREQKVRILQDLAWQLTVFGRAEMAAATALSRIADKTASMPRVTASPATILAHLIQRSGVIREPVPGRIDFVHRTVQEYLAAAQAADNADIEPLIDRAHLDQWRETVIMTAGHANAPLRAQLLAGLLDRAESEPPHSHRLRLLIAACMETIPDVPDRLRGRIDTCIEELVPPRNSTDARPLASVGEEILRRLPASLDSLSVGAAVATVRTTWMINGAGALERLSAYATDPRGSVQDELAAAWSYFDPHEYAERVLANAPLRHGRLRIDDPALLPAVHLLRNLRSLSVSLPENTTSLDCLEGLPALTAITAVRIPAAELPRLSEHRKLNSISFIGVDDPIRDLSQFFDFPELRNLNLYNGKFESDLSFLQHLPQLNSLGLPDLDAVTDFTPLLSQSSLKNLYITRGINLRSLEPIRHLSSLRSLTLGATSLTPGSIEEIAWRWPSLTMLQLMGAPWLTSIAPIVALPLKVMTLNECENLADINPIAQLHRISTLFFFDNQTIDLSPISGLGRLAAINLGGSGRNIDLSPLANLSKLKSIYLRDASEDTDLSPLSKIRNATITIANCRSIRGIGKLHRSVRIDWQ